MLSHRLDWVESFRRWNVSLIEADEEEYLQHSTRKMQIVNNFVEKKGSKTKLFPKWEDVCGTFPTFFYPVITK